MGSIACLFVSFADKKYLHDLHDLQDLHDLHARHAVPALQEQAVLPRHHGRRARHQHRAQQYELWENLA